MSLRSEQKEAERVETPSVWEDGLGLHLANQSIEAVFDPATGAPISLLSDGQELARAEVAQQAWLDIRVDGQWLSTGERPCLELYRTAEDGVTAHVELEWRSQTLLIRERWTAAAGRGALVRQAWVRNEGRENRLFRGFRFIVRGARPGPVDNCYVVIPGETLIRPRMAFRDVLDYELADRFHRADPTRPAVEDRDEGFEAGRLDLPATLFIPDASSGIVCIHNKHDCVTLVATAYSDSEVTTFWLEPSEGERIDLVFTNRVEAWLAPQTGIASGSQYIWAEEGRWQEARERIGSAYAEISPAPPPDRPEWLLDGAVLEVYPGEYGGFEGLRGELPRLRELGFDVLYLLPVWRCLRYDDPRYADLELWRRRVDRSWCPGKIPYFISNFYELDPDLGDDLEFEALIRDAHDLGIRVLLDLVMQGCAEDNPLVRDHPDWFVRTLAGEISTSHGWDYYGPNLSLDWANPAVQKYFRDLAVHQVTTYGVDGFRVDAPMWKESNWASHNPRLPSTTQFGGHEAVKLIRTAVQAVKPEAGLLCEVPGSLFVGDHDVLNDNRVMAMLQLVATGDLTAAELMAALDDLLVAAHPDTRRVYSTENHDSSHWGSSPRGYRGSPIATCLLATCVLMGDVPLVYSGQELAHADVLREMLALRKGCAPLLHGKRVWARPLSPSNEVLTGIRRVDGEAAVVLINFAAESIPATFDLSAAELGDDSAMWELTPLRRTNPVIDRMLIERTASIDIELAPYATYVWGARRTRAQDDGY
jgi:hypothetical protein